MCIIQYNYSIEIEEDYSTSKSFIQQKIRGGRKKKKTISVDTLLKKYEKQVQILIHEMKME